MTEATSTSATTSATSATPKVPKRAQIACTYCRRRKLKCISPGDESPCDRCKASGKDCHYEPVNPPPAGDALPTFNVNPHPYPASPSYTTSSQGDTPWNSPILNPGYSQGQVSGFPPSTGGYQGPYPGHYPPPNPTASHVSQPPMFPPPQNLYPQGRYPPHAHAQPWTENPAQSNSGANSVQGFYGQVPYSSTSHGDYPGSGGGGMPMDYPYYSQSHYHDKDYGHSGGR